MRINKNWRCAFIGILTGAVLSACSGSDEQTETEESESATTSSAVEAVDSAETASSETSNEEETAVVQPENPEPLTYEGDLELPVNGATGYASVRMDLKATADAGSETLAALKAGTAFEVLEGVGDWWYVQTATEYG